MKKSKNEPLTNSQFNVILNLSLLDEKTQFMIKEKMVTEFVDLTKVKTRPGGRVYIYINRKQFSAANYNALIDVLYIELCNQKRKETLTSLLDKYMEFIRAKNVVTTKTCKLYLDDFNKHFRDSYLVTTPICQLEAKDFMDHYESMTQNGLLTKKAFTNAKVIINKLMYFAVQEGIIASVGIATDLDFSRLKFKPEPEKEYAFTEEELSLIFNEAIDKNTPYTLAIALMILIPSRAGDIRGLKYEAINYNRGYIHFNKMLVDSPVEQEDGSYKGYKKEEKDHGKSNTKESNSRKFPITPAIKFVLDRIENLNCSGEYLLMNDGLPLNGGTINRNLKRICEKFGLPDISAHHLRFSNATNLHDDGLSLKIVGKMLGHTNTNTTSRYLISSKNDDIAIKEAMDKIHNHVCNKAWYIKEKEDGNYDT